MAEVSPGELTCPLEVLPGHLWPTREPSSNALARPWRLLSNDPKVCAWADSKAPDLLRRDTPVGGDHELVSFRAAGHAHGKSIEPGEAVVKLALPAGGPLGVCKSGHRSLAGSVAVAA